MTAPLPSRLDANQVLQGSYDEDRGRLRVDSESTIVNADIDVSLDATEDNVAIADPDGDFLEINPDGSINVSLTQKTTSSVYGEVSGVASGITTMISSLVVGASTYLQRVDFSGTNIAEYELVINGSTVDKKRTYFGGSLNDCFIFDQGLPVPAGQLIEVYVVHLRPMTGDFNARIQTLQG